MPQWFTPHATATDWNDRVCHLHLPPFVDIRQPRVYWYHCTEKVSAPDSAIPNWIYVNIDGACRSENSMSSTVAGCTHLCWRASGDIKGVTFALINGQADIAFNIFARIGNAFDHLPMFANARMAGVVYGRTYLSVTFPLPQWFTTFIEILQHRNGLPPVTESECRK